MSGDQESSTPDRPKFSWSETVTIALVSGGAYYTATRYECGYLSYYGVGCDVASIGSELILRRAGSIFIILYLVYMAISSLWLTAYKRRWLPACIAICFLYPLQFSWPGWPGASGNLIIGIGVVIFAYGFPLIPVKSRGTTYFERLDGLLDSYLEAYAGIFHLSKLFGPAAIVLALLFIFVIPQVANALGQGRAHNQTTYRIYDGTWALIGIYGDRAVFVEVDIATPTVTGRSLIRTIDSVGIQLLTKERMSLEPAPRWFIDP